MRGQASDLGSNWLLTRNLNFTRDYLAASQTVTQDDVLRVAEKYFTRQNLTITSLNPKGALSTKSDDGERLIAGEIQRSRSRMVCGFWCAKTRGCR